MIIFLDTSIVIRENYLRSSAASSFLKSVRFLGLRLIVSKVVIDEINGRHRLELTDKYETYCRVRADINKLAGTNLVSDISVPKAHKAFLSWFESIIKDYKIDILPYPKLSLEQVVEASYKRNKPFKSNGEGFKDYLIWESIVSEINKLQEGAAEVYFLTGNVKDFCENKDQEHVLHANLQAGIGNKDRKITVYTGLREFFGERISPLLQRVEPSDIPEFNLGDLLATARKEVEGYLYSYSTYGIEGLQFENDVTIDAVHGVAIADWEIKEMEDGEYLIMITGSVDIEADGFIEKSNFYMNEHKDLYVIDRDWNEWVVAVSQTIETPFTLAMSYFRSSGETIIHSVELDNEYSY